MSRVLKSYYTIKLSIVREQCGDYELPAKITRGDQAATLFQAAIGYEPREVFAALYLNAKHKVIALHKTTIGVADSCVVHPREVFGPALQLGAVVLIVGHNHPSGIFLPSIDDDKVTRRLKSAADILGITMLDHLIVGPADGYYSYAEKPNAL